MTSETAMLDGFMAICGIPAAAHKENFSLAETTTSVRGVQMPLLRSSALVWLSSLWAVPRSNTNLQPNLGLSCGFICCIWSIFILRGDLMMS